MASTTAARPEPAERSRRSSRSPALLISAVLALTLVPFAVGDARASGPPTPTAAPTPAVAPAAGEVAGEVAGAAQPTTGTVARRSRPRARFKVASFNVLGSHHTRRSSRWRGGKHRIRLAASWLAREGTTLVGMSEAQRDQMRVLVQGTRWRSYPHWRGSTNTETAQSVVWRHRTWRKVRARSYRIPFNNGRSREQAVVLLEHRRSGRQVWAISTHLQVGGSARSRRERRVGARRLVTQVRRAHRTGRRVLVLGDMNSHAPIFCRLARDTSLESPSGGSYRRGRCRTPKPRMRRIDWIFGSSGFEWAGFRIAEGRRVQRITDHDVPVSTVSW